MATKKAKSTTKKGGYNPTNAAYGNVLGPETKSKSVKRTTKKK